MDNPGGPRRGSAVSDAEDAEEKTRADYGMYTALVVGVIGFGTAYGLWLSRGCAALPMVSDLGLRPPEAYVFNGTIGLIVPLAALSVAAQNRLELIELRKAGKSIALWGVTVAAGFLACVGALMAGLTAWDSFYWTHFWGAIMFFTAIMLFILGELAIWVQLGYLRKNVPSPRAVSFAWIFLLITFIAACVGMPCFFIFGPDPPCDAGVDPARDDVQCVPAAKRETRFDQVVCLGTEGSLNTLGGNTMSVMEWVVLVGAAASLTSIVLHGEHGPADLAVRERLIADGTEDL